VTSWSRAARSKVISSALGGPLLLLAGSSGIAPLRAMVRHHRAVGSGVPVRLLYSAGAESELTYRDELVAADDGDQVDVRFTLTREQPPD